jgi:hypothetical protein
MTRLTSDDFWKASETWGANCGPGAIAAITECTMDEVRQHLGDFESKHYTNPTLMRSALLLMWEHGLVADVEAVRVTGGELPWARHGICRIQWHGPWMNPGVPIRARYLATHWVGSTIAQSGAVGIFDVNALGNGSGWVSLEDWSGVLVPHLTKDYKRADGQWSITDTIEVVRRKEMP